VRLKDIQDNVMSSSSTLAVTALLELAGYGDIKEFIKEVFSNKVSHEPPNHCKCLLDMHPALM
jgi:hypothetical protein